MADEVGQAIREGGETTHGRIRGRGREGIRGTGDESLGATADLDRGLAVLELGEPGDQT